MQITPDEFEYGDYLILSGGHRQPGLLRLDDGLNFCRISGTDFQINVFAGDVRLWA